jgi:hypothetical protein
MKSGEGLAAMVVAMAGLFSPETLCQSARDFALSALQAHYDRNHRHVPLDAGTALEHLAKACLARRSPALLAELKNESGFLSVVALLGIPGAGAPGSIRTVGLAGALARVTRFVRSKADDKDLRALTDMRNGIVHAREDAEVEERILAAFAIHADALLGDLGRDREDFWGAQLPVVDELPKEARDKVAQRVAVRIAAAEAWLDERVAAEGEDAISMLRTLGRTAALTTSQHFRTCPVCGSYGIATGEHTVEWVASDFDKETGAITNAEPEVWFSAQSFQCRICRLRLDSEAEIDKAFDPVWEIEDASWHDFEPDLGDGEDAAYERWREERDGL